ncbi:acyltransferase [Cerasibacillus sp. JNUCC 74]
MNTVKRPSLDEIQLARAFAILAVVVVHASSSGVTNIPTDSVLFPIYNFFNIAGKLGTPTFIMLSSFVLFYNYYPRKWSMGLMKRFYMKRLKFILIPYFIFSFIYFIVKMYVYYDYSSISYAVSRFFTLLALGKAHTHLYFVFISVQLYLLFPLFLILFKKSSFLRKHAIWIGLLLQWAWVILNKSYFHIPWKNSVSLSYLSFYFIGAYLGIYYNEIKLKLRKSTFRDRILIVIGTGYGGLLILYTSYMYAVRTNIFSSVSNNIPTMVSNYLGEFAWATHALFAGLLLFYLAHIANKTFSLKTKLIFMEIGATSFGIYLVHPLFLMIFRGLISSGAPIIYHSWQLVTFVLVSLLSWLTVRLVYKFIPFYWSIFGKMDPFHLSLNRAKKENILLRDIK